MGEFSMYNNTVVEMLKPLILKFGAPEYLWNTLGQVYNAQ